MTEPGDGLNECNSIIGQEVGVHIREVQWFSGMSADRKKTKLKQDDAVMGGLFNGPGLHLQNVTERNRLIMKRNKHSQKDAK